MASLSDLSPEIATAVTAIWDTNWKKRIWQLLSDLTIRASLIVRQSSFLVDMRRLCCSQAALELSLEGSTACQDSGGKGSPERLYNCRAQLYKHGQKHTILARAVDCSRKVAIFHKTCANAFHGKADIRYIPAAMAGAASKIRRFFATDPPRIVSQS